MCKTANWRILDGLGDGWGAAPPIPNPLESAIKELGSHLLQRIYVLSMPSWSRTRTLRVMSSSLGWTENLPYRGIDARYKSVQAETSSRWHGVVVQRGERCQLRSPRHLIMVQNAHRYRAALINSPSPYALIQSSLIFD
ncbi:hypothetical protein TNCV_2833481 [Trichonephila clavipes]|nr:hypothetical protein TNCV_2833481 [Trichonephila clavipes]